MKPFSFSQNNNLVIKYMYNSFQMLKCNISNPNNLNILAANFVNIVSYILFIDFTSVNLNSMYDTVTGVQEEYLFKLNYNLLKITTLCCSLLLLVL